MLRALLILVLFGITLSYPAPAEDKKEKKKQVVPSSPPTEANVKYGDHERQVLDFYKAESNTPTPVVFFIHGGGWQNGDKKGVGNVKQFLDKGISVAAINYRYVKQGVEMKIEPPSQDELESMFLEQPVIIPESRNEPSSVITAAGRDQAASRVVADEKDKHDIHPNGKRNSKIRD